MKILDKNLSEQTGILDEYWFVKIDERSYLQELSLLIDYLLIFQVQVHAYYDEIIIPDDELMRA